MPSIDYSGSESFAPLLLTGFTRCGVELVLLSDAVFF
jgi:hypothetical protein